LKAADFISLYRADAFIQTLAEEIRARVPRGVSNEGVSHSSAIQIKGLHGSLDAVVVASVYKSVRSNHLVVLHDKEEASFFLNDLQNLLEEKEIFLFPMSYKRPYEYDEVENANVLMRAEVLNQLSTHPEGNIIVTYPEALSEKVINKKSLASNTFIVKKGEQLDRES
jgi:transcription-repair coupling factor (superfamily II helicase)